MADKKTSQLNAATTIFDADDFAVVQDGETKQTNASVVKTYVKAGFTKADAGLGNVDNTSDATKNSATATLTNKTISGATNTLSNIGNSSLTNSSITINGTAVSLGGTRTLVKADVALGNVDNTSDANKPISTATQTALNLKADAGATLENTDIGTAPNEVPLNQYLGDLAYQNEDRFVIRPQTSAHPLGIGEMTFQLTNNTTLVVKVKGTDGTVRSNTLTLA
jgi:hypothetical protein